MNPSRRLSLFLLMSICCAASAVWPQSQRVLIPAGTGISTDSAVTIISTIGEPLIGVQGGAQLQGIGFWGVSAGGNIVLPPILSVDTESLDFGLGSLGDESVVAIAISNNGGQQLVITGLTANLDQISTGVDTLRIGGGDTSSIDIRLERDHIGRLMGLLQLRSNDPSQPAFEIALAGTTGWARGPRIAVEGPVLLGATSIGDTSIHEVRITNLGDASLSLDAVASGNGFRAVTSGLTLTAGASGQVIITYTPGGEGSALGLLTLTSNDPDRPRVELELQAFGGDMNSPLLLDFIVGPGDQGLRTLGNVVAGLQHTIELVLVDAQPLRGWSAQLTFDPAAVGYVPGSFETSDFLAGLVPLTIELPGQLTVGGTALS
ncbi:MAG: choice-of-anchor D domain-containing protein, partial [Gemmatimonadetes bacterium]|nr:choice-of-anchor D domain-containing protein [Gemmatimonadota bacterium]